MASEDTNHNFETAFKASSDKVNLNATLLIS